MCWINILLIIHPRCESDHRHRSKRLLGDGPWFSADSLPIPEQDYSIGSTKDAEVRIPDAAELSTETGEGSGIDGSANESIGTAAEKYELRKIIPL